ncbi:MMPL family transporter [Microbacterium album]|uniref:Membrane protein n=1 Tax=Microbacterium album TaxID=2053191 RepID=A0A917MQ35_9MICO|nr:MMPL family transporter [Microbacterium album]GGH49920.1 membrane protein [Microbacterium album]
MSIPRTRREARSEAPPAAPPAWLRVLLPSVLIVVWFAAAAIGGPYFGRVDEVSSNDRTAYLPATAEATEVQERLSGFADGDAIPAVVVFAADDELTPQDLEAIATALADAADTAAVAGEVSPPIPSEDGLAAQAFVPLDGAAGVGEATAELRETLAAGAPAGVAVFVTGPAGFTSDLTSAFAGIDGLLLGVALAAVLVILVLVYRSLLLPVAVLATSMFALCVALLTVWWLAHADVLLLSGQTQGILFILVIGAATDYALLYVARYRDELVRTPRPWTATLRALRGSIEPIAASGGTVIAGLLCLLLSDLRSNSSLGPVASIGIVFAMLSALTLLPSILLLCGRAAFWPRRPAYDPHAPEAGGTGVWARLAAWIARRPRPIWIATAAVLALGCVGVTQLQASGVPQSELVLGASEAREGQRVLGEHFPDGSGSPASVLVPEDRMDEAVAVLLADDGIADVAVAVDRSGRTAPVTEDGIGAFGPPGTPAPEPVVSDGAVLLQATLTDAADSAAAEDTVRALRAAFDDTVPDALVGGVTATDVDTNDASIRDRTLIVPLVLVVILAILMLLLRSVLAPVLLVATTVLSFGTAMGVAGVVFTHVLGFPGADPAVPLYGFVFLVALGIDYNIFLMSRVREEALAHGTREGVLRGLRLTGGIITSAGLVLAATFTALAVIPVLFLVQIAFIVAFGVLLDTFVVRSLLVPALATDIGRAIWWPSRLARAR